MMKESYEVAREYIKDGDIVFITNKTNPLASVIRFFTRSVYSHVGIAFWVTIAGKKRLMMVESQGGTKRRMVNLSYYKGIDLDIYQSPKLWEDVSDRATSQLGEVRYSWADAGYVGLSEFMLNNFNIRLPVKDFAGEICSEFVVTVYNLKTKPVSPQKLMEHLLQIGCNRKVQIR